MSRTAIICVDDEEIILDSLGKQLKRSLGREYEIELASSGQEALDLCAELEAEGINIALVIFDRLMPGMSGEKLSIELHAAYPKTLKILLTGRGDADSIGNIVNAAALYRYISKPWDETDLILTVKEALRSYGQERQLIQQNILLKETNKKLTRSLNLLQSTFEATDDGILVVDNKGRVITFNQQFASLWQLNSVPIERESFPILEYILERLIEPFVCDLKGKKLVTRNRKYNLLKLKNGKILECYSQTQKLQEQIVGRVWSFRDITAREKEKEIAKQKALHDTITQLPKKSILTCQLTEAIAKIKDDSQILAIMFVELERFKIINDTLGHHIGDTLLKEVVKRLKNCVRERDLIARWGSKEFTLLLPQIKKKQNVDRVACRIINALKLPFLIEQQLIYITANIGIALYPEHGKDTKTLLKNADAALSQAQKSKSHSYQYYDLQLSFQARELLTLENLLHGALAKDEFLLYYQPIVNVKTSKIAKMEALLRWKNPQLGLVSPNIFIPLAEETGEIIPIGEWVLKTACNQNKIWQNMGLAPIKMSVNLSVRQFQQPNLVAKIAEILAETRLKPSYLELEITESATMKDTESAKAIMKKLNEMQICLSMDDFGTGYSSLGYLKQFPFHTLKIDRSFVRDLDSSSSDMAIVNAVITLGKGLNLNIVAEGVETPELQNLLKNLGCEYIQGYLYSKPLPTKEATKLLEKNSFVTVIS